MYIRGVPTCTQIGMCLQLDAGSIIFLSYSQTHLLKSGYSKGDKNNLNDKWLLNEGRKYCRMLPFEHSAIVLTCIK